MKSNQKATGESRVPFDLASFMAMMEEMMGNMECGCDCGEMMSQMARQAESGGCFDIMSQMMAVCCGAEGETEGPTPTEATRQS